VVKVIVCGGRSFYDEQWLKNELCDLVWQRGRFKDVPQQITVLIHGGARGVDTMAANFAIGCGLKLEEFKADWERHGKAAGPLRNQEMLDAGPDLVVAFPGGRGTADMVRRAKSVNVPVIELLPH
jgi:hypothetical protein